MAAEKGAPGHLCYIRTLNDLLISHAGKIRMPVNIFLAACLQLFTG